MTKYPTTVRLDPHLQKEVIKAAKQAGLTFSSVVHLLLHAFIEGTVQIGVTQVPLQYLKALEQEATALRRSHRRGKAKIYRSSKALFDDILGR